MDRLEAMQVLLQVVEQGNLSAAGRKMGVPLTTISRKIADLEAHLGARLLIRSNRHVTLTEAGHSYLAASKRILAEVAEAEAAASGAFTKVRGDLTITAPLVFGRLHVLPLVSEFLSLYPDINIHLTLADRLLHLQDEHVDAAFRIGALPDSSLKAIRLGAVTRVVCASPGYLERRGQPLIPADLRLHDCISFTGLGAENRWAFQVDAAPQLLSIQPRLSVNSAEAAIDASAAGLGITRVLSYQVAAAQRSGALVRVLEPFETAAVPVNLVFDGQGGRPAKLRAFLEFVTPRLRQVLGLPAKSS
jgi:DNA-binding transcriptional LysR family regulator